VAIGLVCATTGWLHIHDPSPPCCKRRRKIQCDADRLVGPCSPPAVPDRGRRHPVSDRGRHRRNNDDAYCQGRLVSASEQHHRRKQRSASGTAASYVDVNQSAGRPAWLFDRSTASHHPRQFRYRRNARHGRGRKGIPPRAKSRDRMPLTTVAFL